MKKNLVWKFEAKSENLKPALKGFENDNPVFMLVDYGTENKEDWQVIEPVGLRGMKVDDVELFKSCVEDMTQEALKEKFEKEIKLTDTYLMSLTVLDDVWKNIMIEREKNSSWIRNLTMLIFFGESKQKRIDNCSFSFANNPSYRKSWDFYMSCAKNHLNNSRMISALQDYALKA